MSEDRAKKLENRVDALEKRTKKLEDWLGLIDQLAQQSKNRLDRLEKMGSKR